MSLWKKQNLGPRINRIVDKQRLEEEHPRKINGEGVRKCMAMSMDYGAYQHG